jgi:hypothetical protein
LSVSPIDPVNPIEQHAQDGGVSARPDPLELGRDAYDRQAWHEAWRQLSRADRAAPLGVADLERLALAAYLVGHDDEYQQALERALRG